MVLAQGENLIKSWNYADSKAGGLFKKVKTKALLEVTNKRIVYTAESDKATDRQEIYIDDVNSLTMTRFSKGNLWAIIKIVFFGILSLVLVGIPGLIRSIKELNQGSFELTITVKEIMSKAMEIGVVKLLPTKAKSTNVKILINKDVVKEIVETLGAVIVENRMASEEKAAA